MYFPASPGDELLYRNRPSAKFVALPTFLQVRAPNWSTGDKTRSHRSICQLNFYSVARFLGNLLKVQNLITAQIPAPLTSTVFSPFGRGKSRPVIRFYMFFKCFLGARGANRPARRGSGTSAPHPSREAYSGRVTPPPSNYYYHY